jgi:hypothetical protein
MQQTGYSIPEIIVTSPKRLWSKRMNIFRLAAVFRERCHVIAYSSMGTADSASVSEGKPRTAGRRHWPLGWNCCVLRYLHPPLLAAHTCMYINTFLNNASTLELKGRNALLSCSELSSGLYCRVEWLSTDVSEVRTWWWRQYAPLNRRSTIILHGSTSQKTILNLILAAVRTWNLTELS